MISLKQLLIEAETKIYLKKGEKPPKGKKIEKGPRGGQYFTGSAAEKKAHEKGDTKPAAKDEPKGGKPKIKMPDDHPIFGKNLASDRQKKNGTEVYKMDKKTYNITPTKDGNWYVRYLPDYEPGKFYGLGKPMFAMIKKSPTKNQAYKDLQAYIEKKTAKTQKKTQEKESKAKVLKKYGLESYKDVGKNDYKEVTKHVPPKLKAVLSDALKGVKEALGTKHISGYYSVVDGQLYIETGYSKFNVEDYFKKQPIMAKALKQTLEKYGIQFGKPINTSGMGAVISMVPIQS
jgi:hypothetical protein